MKALLQPGKSDEWGTPRKVFDALGEVFDLDVASPGPTVVPWVPADFVYTHSSLELPWFGFVWMNPPFGGRNGYLPWAEKFIAHGNGIALTPASTGAAWCQKLLRASDAVLFWSPRLSFIPLGGQDVSNPTFATALCGIGDRAVAALERASSNGTLLHRRK